MARARSATKKKHARKSAPRAKTSHTKTKTALRAPAKSARSAARAAAPRKLKPRKPQRVAISHHRDEDFASGLRTYAAYRDLGIADATDGMVRAHVIRFVEPCDPAVVSKLHYHDTQFQMVYVLKGWVKTELEGQGEVLMREGSSWTQPPKIRHVINDYSDDCELLEVILPAEFDTVEV
jgi:mannose-6-phosphate isomerase-like protein (cupin superfamily)